MANKEQFREELIESNFSEIPEEFYEDMDEDIDCQSLEINNNQFCHYGRVGCKYNTKGESQFLPGSIKAEKTYYNTIILSITCGMCGKEAQAEISELNFKF